jgi:uncharacterized damage-inducible protein DinB
MIQQLPWTQRKFSFDFPIAIFPVIFSRLEGSIYRLETLIQYHDTDFSVKKNGAWSIKEHVGHLIDLESLWWERLEDYKAGKPTLTAADMSNEKTNKANHNEKTITELVDEFLGERDRMLDEIYYYDESFLSKSALHPRLQQPMRVIDSLYFVAEHDDHHIATIKQLLHG